MADRCSIPPISPMRTASIVLDAAVPASPGIIADGRIGSSPSDSRNISRMPVVAERSGASLAL